jgi:mediator of RNA polymerase II transcription subunit 23
MWLGSVLLTQSFPDRPITYLYNTLHYYESRLRDKPNLKKKLVGSILGSLKDIKPSNWALSEQYNNYLASSNGDEAIWTPEMDYYVSLIARFVDGEEIGDH